MALSAVCAVMVMKIAIGEIEEPHIVQAKRKAGLAGGRTRTKTLSKERRSELARKAARARWERARILPRIRGASLA